MHVEIIRNYRGNTDMERGIAFYLHERKSMRVRLDHPKRHFFSFQKANGGRTEVLPPLAHRYVVPDLERSHRLA
jgi:hypothetical protein